MKFCFGSDAVNPTDKFTHDDHWSSTVHGKEPNVRILRVASSSVTADFLSNLVQVGKRCICTVHIIASGKPGLSIHQSLVLILVGLEGFQEQIDWGCDGNPLNATSTNIGSHTLELEFVRTGEMYFEVQW